MSGKPKKSCVLPKACLKIRVLIKMTLDAEASKEMKHLLINIIFYYNLLYKMRNAYV